jgi:hypothetical protein
MINFRKGHEPNNSKNDLAKKLQKILDIVYNDAQYYPGSFHPDTDLSQVTDAIFQILFNEHNESVHIIIDKNPNNSLDMTIDKIE